MGGAWAKGGWGLNPGVWSGLVVGVACAGGGACPEPGSQAAAPLPAPAHLQHMYVWLASEKAQERQRAVHSCMALLKFLRHNLYLDVSTRPSDATSTPALLP